MQITDKMRDETMLLPTGKTCADCRHFKRTCEWLISCDPTNTACDWAPSRFSPSLMTAETAQKFIGVVKQLHTRDPE